MGKVNLTMVVFTSFVFLLSLLCSMMLGLTGYAFAERWPLLDPSPAVAAPAPAATVVPSPIPEPETASKIRESRVEYYRGMFDLCVFSGRNSDSPEKVVITCHEIVRRAMEQNWFELPSREWTWPLPNTPSKFNRNG